MFIKKLSLFIVLALCVPVAALAQMNKPVLKVEDAGLKIEGDPRIGVKWPYKGVDKGVEYDISGYVIAPEASYGKGPFPAMIITHGYGGHAEGFVGNLGRIIKNWGGGIVCIGVSMTHAGAPDNIGKPDGGRGACEANLLRAAKCLEVLAQFSVKKDGFSVNMKKVGAYGFSMGGSLTTMLLGDSRTAGKFYMGMIAGAGEGSTGVTKAMVQGIKVPILILHGNYDSTDGDRQPAGKRSILAEKMIATLRGTTIKFNSGGAPGGLPDSGVNKGIDFDKTYNWNTRPLPELYARDPERYTLVSKGVNDAKFRFIDYETGQHTTINPSLGLQATDGAYMIPAFKDWVLRTGFLKYIDTPVAK